MTLFDETKTPTALDRPHPFSIDTPVPHGLRLDVTRHEVERSGTFSEWRLRGTATRCLVSSEPGALIRMPFVGRAVSVILPMDFVPPGPRLRTLGGELRARVDGSDWINIPNDCGREVLVGSGLSAGPHVVEIKCRAVDAGPCGLEAIRAWDVNPAAVTGRIEGGPMLADLRADVSGPVQFSRAVRNARNSTFSLLLPLPGRYEVNLHATGWEPHSLTVTIDTPGQVVQLPDIALTPLEISLPQPRALSEDEPLVLVCFAHANIWGQEPAEWLARRVNWINSQKPHAALDANEMNPVYVLGALRRLQCPLLMCSGNHSMDGFEEALPATSRTLGIAPSRIITAGKSVPDNDLWEQASSPFTEQDKLRIVCSYEPYAPVEWLTRCGIRFYFYGHSLVQPCHWERGRTQFLRKVDANTFYRVEIGPPHDLSAPIRIQRFIFRREE